MNKEIAENVPSSNKDYHELMSLLSAAVSSGKLGEVEVANKYFSRHDAPYQVTLRDLRTGRVRLIDLNLDGSVST
jgi:hypothetical protein